MIDTSVLNVDFEILGCSSNCKSMKIVDLSNWGPAIMNPTYVDITPPGATSPVSNNFQKGQINVLNTNNLQLSDVTDYSFLGNLPDGVYQVCIRVCMGEDTTQTPPVAQFRTTCKYHLQDCMIRCAIDRKLLSIDLTCQSCRKELLDDLMDIQLFLDAARAQIDNCNVNKGMEYFRHASVLLERLQKPGNTPNSRGQIIDDCPECWPGRRLT